MAGSQRLRRSGGGKEVVVLRPGPAPGASGEAVLTAVLSALAGVRRGDRVAAVGSGPRVAAALLAMSGTSDLVDGDARVVVAGSATDVPLAVARLAPGGRLVAVAADAAAARRVAALHDLTLRHVEPLGRLVAWVALREPSGSQPDVGGGAAAPRGR